MESGCNQIVVAGTGQGGFQAALSLREGGFRGHIVLVGDEPGLPYQRPPLSKAYLAGKVDAADLQLRGASFYSKHNIEVRAGERVVDIDRRAARLKLVSGEGLAYDHLILATGARNRALPVAGSELRNVHYLRTLAEAATIRETLPRVRRVAVIGAGFIGLEFAAFAVSQSLDVTVFEAADRPMGRAVSGPTSSFFGEAHGRAGVRLEYGALVAEISEADGRAAGVKTADGRHFAADFVLIGIGVLPNIELAQDAGLAVGDGIEVDENLLTSDRAVSAIGDCASFPCKYANGARIRLESVQNAVDHARCVAMRLLGRAERYKALPWFWSDQGAFRLKIAGLADPHDKAVIRGDPMSDAFSVFRFNAGRLRAVESINQPAEHLASRRLLATESDITPEMASDLSINIKDLVGVPRPTA